MPGSHRFSGRTHHASRLVLGAAAVLTAITLAGCGASILPNSGSVSQSTNAQHQTEILAPTAIPQGGDLSASAGAALIASVAAELKAAGINCPGFKATGMDPGAVAQGACGFPIVIEIAAFPRHDVITQQFAPFLASDFCGSKLTSLYVNGGMYAIYTTDDPTTLQIASALKLSATKLC